MLSAWSLIAAPDELPGTIANGIKWGALGKEAACLSELEKQDKGRRTKVES